MLPNFFLKINDCQWIMIYYIIYPVLQCLIDQLPSENHFHQLCICPKIRHVCPLHSRRAALPVSQSLGPFLTAMTFWQASSSALHDQIFILNRVFLCGSAHLKNSLLAPRAAISTSMSAHILPAIHLLKWNLNIVCALFKRSLNMMC